MFSLSWLHFVLFSAAAVAAVLLELPTAPAAPSHYARCTAFSSGELTDDGQQPVLREVMSQRAKLQRRHILPPLFTG